MKTNWKLVVALLVIAGGATGLTLNKRARGHMLGVWQQLAQASAHAEEPEPDKSWTREPPRRPRGTVRSRLTDSEIKAIGLETVPVLEQTEPTVLPLFGTTDYVPATVTIVRTQFDSRVEKVLVDLGATVKKGDPLLELFSTDLAAAKSDYEVACSQCGTRQEGLRLQDPAGQGEHARQEGVDRGRERRGSEPAQDEAGQGQAPGLRLDREGDRRRPERGRRSRRPG